MSKAMKGVKIGLSVLALLIAGLILAFLIGFFQRLIVSGAEFVSDLGDKLLLTEEDETPEATEDLYSRYYRQNIAGPTVSPGDDPSWESEMPEAPVDKTAEELAREAAPPTAGP